MNLLWWSLDALCPSEFTHLLRAQDDREQYHWREQGAQQAARHPAGPARW